MTEAYLYIRGNSAFNRSSVTVVAGEHSLSGDSGMEQELSVDEIVEVINLSCKQDALKNICMDEFEHAYVIPCTLLNRRFHGT